MKKLLKFEKVDTDISSHQRDWENFEQENNNNNNNFQNALHDELNYQTIESNPQRISKLKPYINN